MELHEGLTGLPAYMHERAFARALIRASRERERARGTWMKQANALLDERLRDAPVVMSAAWVEPEAIPEGAEPVATPQEPAQPVRARRFEAI